MNKMETEMMYFLQENSEQLHMLIVEGKSNFRLWLARMVSRGTCTYLPYTYWHPVIDMLNHTHLCNSSIFVVNPALHKSNDCDSYFDPEKFLCDFSLITGKQEGVLDSKPLPN